MSNSSIYYVLIINYFKGIDAKGDYYDGNGKCATVQVLRTRMNMPRIGLINKYLRLITNFKYFWGKKGGNENKKRCRRSC